MVVGNDRCKWNLGQAGLGIFLSASVAVAAGGMEEDLRPHETVGMHAERLAKSTANSALAFGSGRELASTLGCGGLSNNLMLKTRAYLHKEEDSKAAGLGSAFMGGCVVYNRRQFTQEQCRCLGEVGRVLVPSIYLREFDYQDSVADIKKHFVLTPFLLKCGL